MNKNFIKLLLIFVFIVFVFISRLGAEEELVFPNPQATISMDFQDARLKDILKLFSIQSGSNFIASETLQDRKVTLYLDKVPIKDAMNKIFKANNLAFEEDKVANIIIVKDLGKPETETITKVFYLKYATVASASLEKEKKSNMESSGSSTNSSEDGGITKTIQKLISPNGSVIEDPRTNSLIVTDIPGRMKIITQTIAAMDVSVPQVLLEVEMLDVNKNATDAIGVKFGTSPLALAFTGASMSVGPPFGSWLKSFGSEPRGKIWANSQTSTDPAYNVYTATLDFLRTQSDTKFLARPKILTLNNETAEIKITTNEAIGVTTNTASTGGSSGSTTQEAERAETGVSLRVTPQINTETGEITMFIVPSVSEALSGGTFTTSGTTSITFKDPETRSTKSIVRVKDGETVVIGGLIRKQKSETITKLPFLGDLPLVGGLFRHKYKDKDKERELIVFITPHIIKENNNNNNKVNSIPAQSKKAVFPKREQSIISGANRQMAVNNYLNAFDKNKR